MRTSGDVYGADAGSSRNDEERVFKEDLSDCSSPMRNRQNDSNSQPGSQRFVNSLRKDEETRNNPIQPTDQQQAELLRKLDSLKGHVLRGGGNNPNVVDLPPPPQGFHAHGLPSYYNPHPEPFSYGIYPTHVPPYGNPYGFPMHRTPQNFYPGPGHYPNQIPPRPPFPQGQYVDIGPDLFDPQLQDPRFFPVTPSTYGDVPYSPVVHHGEKIGPFSPHGGVQGHHHTRWPSEIEYEMGGGGQGHHTRWPSEIESEMGGGGGGQVHHTRWPSEIDSKMGGGAFAQGHVQKATYDSRRCYPLAGGAPFIACHNCFELLYLPKKKILAQERQQKLQCGACSEVTSFKIVDKKLVFCSSALEETTNQVSVEVEDRSATTAAVDDYPRTHRKTKSVQDASPSVHSDDEERLSISSEPQKQVVKSVRHRAKGTKAPPPPPENSNLLELFEYSNVNRAALTYGMAQLGYNKQESYAKQDSLKPESVATETDVSYNEYYNNNTDVSEDSRISKTSKGEIRPRHRKESSEYSLPEVTNEIISHDLDNEQLEVWVNGHLIPEDLVISAEKLAGPVQAGKYWYDYRAGFWGVMGNPCLGIIPPFIEEFSRPMPDNCGAGNTSVFVNGRELHERDLELLSRRGLPREKNRSYIVDISGRVLDGDSGEELKSLGRLAPTVDKVKHGFGMRVPRSLMSSA